MKKHFLFLAIILLLSIAGQAYEMKIYGKVRVGDTPELGLAGQTVVFYTENGAVKAKTQTDTTGFFVQLLQIPDGYSGAIIVETVDPCNSTLSQAKVRAQAGSAEVDLIVCAFRAPGCVATFETKRLTSQKIQFFASSRPPAAFWLWSFGDGTFSTDQNPIHAYQKNGAYSVSLLIITPDGCQASVKETIQIGESSKCEADFEYSQSAGNLYSVYFYDTSFSGQDSVLKREWNFGLANSVSREPTTIFNFPGPGIYKVSLTIYTANNCSSTIVKEVKVAGEPCVCTKEYNPVCVLLPDGSLKRFGNECMARCEGYTNFVPCDSTNCVCPEIYDPVCALDRLTGKIIEFPNRCFAACAGYTTFVDCEANCNCPRIYDPVCAIDTFGNKIQFPNACVAKCEGYTEFVPCDSLGCICPAIYDPVCAFDSLTGTIIEFSNKCEAACKGYTQLFDCKEPPFCNTDEIDPVCVVTTDGVTISFQNRCEAWKAGYRDFFKCEGNCNCPTTYKPVCAVDSLGMVKKFLNACHAECAGYRVTESERCENCICPAIYDPVCVYTPEGKRLIFGNACEAECAGYKEYERCSRDSCVAVFIYKVLEGNGLKLQFIQPSLTAIANKQYWDFGDGVFSEEINPFHAYTEPGVYKVTLTVVYANDCKTSTSQEIWVGKVEIPQKPDCQALFDFAFSPDNPLKILFKDRSWPAQNEAIYSWDFGDGKTSDARNPIHLYEKPGLYQVTLNIRTRKCESKLTLLVWTNGKVPPTNNCQAYFYPVIKGDMIVFIDQSIGVIKRRKWDFGDGTGSDARSPEHLFKKYGRYKVQLTIVTQDGCTHSYEMWIDTATPIPVDVNNPKQGETNKTVHLPEAKLFPNPALEELNIEWESLKGVYDWTISDLSGKIIKRGKNANAPISPILGPQQIRIPISDLPRGIYLIQFAFEGRMMIDRFIKE